MVSGDRIPAKPACSFPSWSLCVAVLALRDGAGHLCYEGFQKGRKKGKRMTSLRLCSVLGGESL